MAVVVAERPSCADDLRPPEWNSRRELDRDLDSGERGRGGGMKVSDPSDGCCPELELADPSSSVMLPVLLKADDRRFGLGSMILFLDARLDDDDDVGTFLFRPGLRRV